jgi:hypothetical protein
MHRAVCLVDRRRPSLSVVVGWVPVASSFRQLFGETLAGNAKLPRITW